MAPLPVDAGWFRKHLLDEILPPWLRHAEAPGGIFLPQLDRQWQPLPNQHATLVSQSRLLFNFAQGYRITGDGVYLQAVQAGADALLRTFRDRRYGGWFWSCAPDGTPLDIRKDTYGHAFVLFGLAHACQVTGRRDLHEAALHTWEVLDTRLRDSAGGFVMRAEGDFGRPAEGRSANPVMHLFEALQAFSDCEPAFLAEAGRVARFALARVHADDGLLPERYDHAWRELDDDAGGYLDLGHQFEWAYLLSAGVERGLPADLLGPAGLLLDGGVRLGLDPADGGVLSQATPGGVVRPGGKVNWPQCEAIRAMLHFAVLRGRTDLWEPLGRLLACARERLIDAEYGGWYPALTPEGTPSQDAKGSEWKVDYHVVGMCLEAIRLLG